MTPVGIYALLFVGGLILRLLLSIGTWIYCCVRQYHIWGPFMKGLKEDKDKGYTKTWLVGMVNAHMDHIQAKIWYDAVRFAINTLIVLSGICLIIFLYPLV